MSELVSERERARERAREREREQSESIINDVPRQRFESVHAALRNIESSLLDVVS